MSDQDNDNDNVSFHEYSNGDENSSGERNEQDNAENQAPQQPSHDGNEEDHGRIADGTGWDQDDEESEGYSGGGSEQHDSEHGSEEEIYQLQNEEEDQQDNDQQNDDYDYHEQHPPPHQHDADEAEGAQGGEEVEHRPHWPQSDDQPEGVRDDVSELLREPIAEGSTAGESLAADEFDTVPDFANKYNRNLHAEIQKQEKEVLRQERNAEEHKNRVSVMRTHLHNVQNEIQHTQKLVQARNEEIRTEDHMRQMSERSLAKVRKELEALKKQNQEIQDEISSVQMKLHTNNEALEQFREQMNWNQQELEQWVEAARQKDEDNLALEKYTKADDEKTRELARRLEKLTEDLHQKQRDLDHEVTETQAKQIELDKTADDFHSLHSERQELVSKWKDAIRMMESRDHEIAEAGEKFATAKTKLARRKETIAELSRMLNRQNRDNKDMEEEVKKINLLAGRKRDEYQAIRDRFQNYKNDVELLKSELDKAASDLTQLRATNKNYSAAVEEKRQQVEMADLRLRATQSKLEKAREHTHKIEKTATQREEEAEEESKRLARIEREIEALKEKSFKQNQELFKLKKEESNLIAEISGARSTAKNLSDKINSLDAEALRQQELVYSADFQIQQMERKVARAKGERSDEEKKMLQARIDELMEERDEVQATEKKLREQSKRLKEELKAVSREQEQLHQKLKSIEDKTHDLMLENKSAGNTLKSVSKEKEEAMVEHDLLKLEVRKLRNALSERSDEVYNLENRINQLQLSKEERKKEIESHQKMQRANIKLLEEERHKLAMDVQNRAAQVQKLRNKYTTICARIRGSEEDDGQPRSQAHFVIQQAQKREELQRQGDELDASIKQCEREIKALVTTLKHLTIRNSEYRTSFHKAGDDNSKTQNLKSLEQQLRDSTDLLFQKKRELQRVSAEADEERQRQNTLRDQQEQLKSRIEALRGKRNDAARDQEAQVNKLQEREEQLEEVKGTVKQHINEDQVYVACEKDIEAATIKATTQNVLYTLKQLANLNKFPQLAHALQEKVKARQLSLPARPPRPKGVQSQGTPHTTSAVLPPGVSQGEGNESSPGKSHSAQSYWGGQKASSRPETGSSQSSSVQVKTFEFGL